MQKVSEQSIRTNKNLSNLKQKYFLKKYIYILKESQSNKKFVISLIKISHSQVRKINSPVVWEWDYLVHCSEEQCGIILHSAGEERPADSESSGGQAVDDNQRPSERAGWAEDRAGSHAAPDEPDLLESEESDWAQLQGKNPTRPQYHESGKTMIS